MLNNNSHIKNQKHPPNIFFSVVMVFYNSEQYIEESIKSVINQTFKNWELIIVDDGSKDLSYKIALKYQKQDQRIKFFKLNKNKGQGFARNYAINKASGDWISTLDSDDLFLINKLEEFKKVIDKSKIDHPILIGSGVSLINEKGKIMKNYYYPTKSKILKKNLLKLQKFPAHSSLVCHRKTLLEVGGYNELYYRSQDYDLWLRLMNKGRFYCTKKILILYRTHNANVSNKNVNKYSQFHYGIAALICNFLRANKFYDPSHNKKKFNFLLEFIDSIYQSSFQYEIIQKKKMLQEANKFLTILILIKFLLFSPNLFLRLLIERFGYLYFYKKVLKNYINKYIMI